MNTAALRLGWRGRWVTAALPVAGLAVLAALLLDVPVPGLGTAPPVETVAVERTVLREGTIELRIRNDGPDPVTVAQVLVNEAYRPYTISDGRLGRLDGATVRVPYPWEVGFPLQVTLLTSTGVTIEHEIDPAVVTPEPDPGTLGSSALLGLYMGVVPVALGLLWLPSLRRASLSWLAFVLALTAGLLAFLLVDTLVEGLAVATEASVALGGPQLFWLGALTVLAAMVAVDRFVSRDRTGATPAAPAAPPARAGGLRLAYLVAAGIGLHNLGEGLAVGAAAATGQLGLGTSLIVGFALHNTTEGLAIATPLGSAPVRRLGRHLVALVTVAGGPTIAGAALGGLAFSPTWAALAFGMAAGAVAHVLWAVGRSVADGHRHSATIPLGFAAGLVVMYTTGLLAG